MEYHESAVKAMRPRTFTGVTSARTRVIRNPRSDRATGSGLGHYEWNPLVVRPLAGGPRDKSSTHGALGYIGEPCSEPGVANQLSLTHDGDVEVRRLEE